MFEKFTSLFRPAPHIARLPEEQQKKEYTKLRWQVFLSVYFGYAAFYLVRSTFSLAKPYLINNFGYTKTDVGLIAAGLSLSYGVSKFLMGNVSDRSNPRYFMAAGLLLSGLMNLIFPSIAFSLWAMATVWFVNGWAQGMGWAPCARTLTHWFSCEERGTKFAIWNTAHNIGGGLDGPIINCVIALIALFGITLAKESIIPFYLIFYVPSVMAIVMSIFLLIFLRDTPQSCGLPSIEDYTGIHPNTGVADVEKEMSAKEIFVKYVFNNKLLWIIALANFFVYTVRYGVVNWAPTYLTAVKGATNDMARWQFFIYEFAGIAGTLLAGWASDKLFKGRRGPVNVIYMVLVFLFVWIYWKNPAGNTWVDSMSLFTIGFLIYGPIMLIGVSAVDLAPKKAAGTAAGFTGLFGYLGAVLAEIGIGKVVDATSWDGGFGLLLGCCVISIILLAFTWNKRTIQE